MFKLTNGGGVTNPSIYSSCQAALSVIGSNYVLRIPMLILGGTSYWLDLTYVPTKDGFFWKYGGN